MTGNFKIDDSSANINSIANCTFEAVDLINALKIDAPAVINRTPVKKGAK